MSISQRQWVAVLRFIHDARGVTGSEYALIATLVALVIVAGLSLTGVAIESLWTGIGDCTSTPSADCM
jgi:Flp pilus assembly pilin Flp